MTNQQDYIPLPFHDRKFDISLSEKISRVDLTRKTQDSRGTHDSRTTRHDPRPTTLYILPLFYLRDYNLSALLNVRSQKPVGGNQPLKMIMK